MPRNVALFELLAYVALGVGLFTLPFAIGAILNVLATAGAAAGSAGTFVLIFTVLGGLVGFALYGLLVWAAARKRQNWARIVYAVLILIGLIASAFNTDGLQLIGLFSIGSFAIQTLLQFAALYFVFTRDANPWFDRNAATASARK